MDLHFCMRCASRLPPSEHGHARVCNRCGWIWEPSPVLEAVLVLERRPGEVAVMESPPGLPRVVLAAADDPESAALRAGQTVTGLPLGAPRFLGFLHTHDPLSGHVVIAFAYLCHADGARGAGVTWLRLRDIPFLQREQDRYALDVYRAWLERNA